MSKPPRIPRIPEPTPWRLNDAVVIAIALIALALGMAGVFG